jgi:hypothetical protein
MRIGIRINTFEPAVLGFTVVFLESPRVGKYFSFNCE